MAQPPPESQVPALSHPVDPAIFAPAASAQQNSETALSGNLGKLEGSRKVDKPAVSGKVDQPAVSRKVDHGPMRDHWLRYSLVRG